MTDLAGELRSLGGGGTFGTVLSISRYWPAAVCGLMVPGTLTGSVLAAGMLVAGASGVALVQAAEKQVARSPG